MLQILIPIAVLTLLSLVTLSSISTHLFVLQAVWIIFGCAIILLCRIIDWRSFVSHEWFIGSVYALSVFFLILVLFIGPVIRNTRSWLVIGPFSFQPVELAKIALILAYARYFSRRHLGIARWKYIFTSFILFLIPAALVLRQPNLGSVLILFGIWFGLLLFSGLPRQRLLIALLAFAVAGIVAWNSGILKDYQRERIRGVFSPHENALTVNYSVIQAKIAIGSAGVWGKGYGQGTQTQLGFLSLPENDFILAALIEEWGIVGGFVAIGAFLMLTLALIRVGIAAERNFEKFIALGTALMFLAHFLINAGSTVGLFPVVGVTFPFLSYGGSSLLTDFSLLAIINAIGGSNRS